MFALWFALLGGSFVFLYVGISILFFVFLFLGGGALVILSLARFHQIKRCEQKQIITHHWFIPMLISY
jgi:hypothetical protein